MKMTAERSNQRPNHPLLLILILIGAVLIALPNLAGCRPSLSPPGSVGGDRPVTSDRLDGARLTYIRGTLSWSFRGADLLIDNENRPIPSDVIEEILGDGSAPKQIQAKWSCDERAAVLQLYEITADGIKHDGFVSIAIAPAGAVRVNLGTRQYNVFPQSALQIGEETLTEENKAQGSAESPSRTVPR